MVSPEHVYDGVHEIERVLVAFAGAVQAALPPAPVAVPEYVVVCAGETCCEPLRATEPSGEIVNELAFEDDHVSVASVPDGTDEGSTEIEHAGGWFTVRIAGCVLVSPCGFPAVQE